MSESTHLVHLEDKEKDEGLNWERGADVMQTGRVGVRDDGCREEDLGLSL